MLQDKTQTEEQGIKRHAHHSPVPPLAASLTPPFLALGFQQGPRWYFLVFSSNKLPQAKRRVLKQHKLEQLTVLEVQEPPQAPLGSSPGVPGLLSRLETPGETLCWFLEAPHMPRLTAAPPAPKPQQDNRRLYLGRRFPLLRTLVITLNSPGWVARPPLPIGQLISTTNSTCSRPAPTRCRLIGKHRFLRCGGNPAHRTIRISVALRHSCFCSPLGYFAGCFPACTSLTSPPPSLCSPDSASTFLTIVPGDRPLWTPSVKWAVHPRLQRVLGAPASRSIHQGRWTPHPLISTPRVTGPRPCPLARN